MKYLKLFESWSKEDRIRQIKLDETIHVYEDDKILVVIPKTYDSIKLYGSNTMWCVTTDEEIFDSYNDDDAVYLFIIKGTNHKYIFQFEHDFKNELDGDVDFADFINKYPEVKELMKSHIINDTYRKYRHKDMFLNVFNKIVSNKLNVPLFEFKETDKNTPTLYKDENLEVKVVKTFDASCEQGRNTEWCSNSPSGFYGHNRTANMYRFNFKDGYKLRLTWDYISQGASSLGKFSGGTHWGQGGKVNGNKKSYENIRPKDENKPFDFNYDKGDDKQEMVDRILSIPDDAQLAVYEYQEKHMQEKNALTTNLYKEIEKIKVVDVKLEQVLSNRTILKVKIEYMGKVYDIEVNFYNEVPKGANKWQTYWLNTKKFKDIFKSHYNHDELEDYLYDKTREFIKKNGLEHVLSNIKKVDLEDY